MRIFITLMIILQKSCKENHRLVSRSLNCLVSGGRHVNCIRHTNQIGFIVERFIITYNIISLKYRKNFVVKDRPYKTTAVRERGVL